MWKNKKRKKDPVLENTLKLLEACKIPSGSNDVESMGLIASIDYMPEQDNVRDVIREHLVHNRWELAVKYNEGDPSCNWFQWYVVCRKDNDDVIVIGHPDLNDVVVENLGAGGAPAYYPEVSPYLTARVVTQFNGYMPSEGPDAYILPTNLTQVEYDFIPVNTPVQDGQVMNVLGIDMQFLDKAHSDNVYPRLGIDYLPQSLDNGLLEFHPSTSPSYPAPFRRFRTCAHISRSAIANTPCGR